MKLKITAALLACFMLLASLSACGKNKDEDPDDTGSKIPVLTSGSSGNVDDPVDPDTSTSASETTAAPTDTSTAATTTTKTPEGTTEPPALTTEATTTTSATTATTTAPVVKFTECNDTVYIITSALNVRTSPAMGDNIYTSVTQGTALTRTGYSEDWYRVLIEGKEYYISANPAYVSLDDPNAEIEFSVRYETVYVTADSLYIRETPHSAGTIYDTLTKGTELIRVGYSETWSRVMYDGKLLYCGSKYLSTENPITTTTTAAG